MADITVSNVWIDGALKMALGATLYAMAHAVFRRRGKRVDSLLKEDGTPRYSRHEMEVLTSTAPQMAPPDQLRLAAQLMEYSQIETEPGRKKTQDLAESIARMAVMAGKPVAMAAVEKYGLAARFAESGRVATADSIAELDIVAEKSA